MAGRVVLFGAQNRLEFEKRAASCHAIEVNPHVLIQEDLTVFLDDACDAEGRGERRFQERRLADRDADVLGLGESTAVKYAAAARNTPVFALRTKDGGALVLLATNDVRNYGPAVGAPAGLKLAVTGDYAALAGATQLRTMTVKRLDLWLAAVPVGEGAVQVLGARSGLLAVTGKP